jgi:hypothetical protein
MVQPLYDGLSGINLFHYAYSDLYYSSIVTRSTEASPSWFTSVQREIYRYYSNLASSMAYIDD